MSEDAGPHSRFPFGPAVLCAACPGTAIWLWLEFSYAWPLTDRPQWIDGIPWNCRGPYVLVEGVYGPIVEHGSPVIGPAEIKGRDDWAYGQWIRAKGRLVYEHPGDVTSIYVDATASRFHPASVAGIVVGAMGCFVFGLYLRRWLRERKAAA